MPRIEVIAQWRKPDGIYESLIGSTTITDEILTDHNKRAHVLQAHLNLIQDALTYEAGEPTDMAQKVLSVE